MNVGTESFVAPIVARNDDPWTALAHRIRDFDEDHSSQNPFSATTSVGSSPTAVFSSPEPSIVTKPTSYGTGNPVYDQHNEGKANVTYAASLSATHGSGSEAEGEHDDMLHTTLLGAGAWSSSHQTLDQCLRKRENARTRLSEALPNRLKKPSVVLHQYNRDEDVLLEDTTPLSLTASIPIEEGQKCLLYRVPRQRYIVLGMICLTVLTVFLSGSTVYSTDKAKTALRKRIIFAATTILSLETTVTMLAARRSLLEALALGLFPLIFGFMCMLNLDGLA